MPEEQQAKDPISSLLSEFGTRLNEIEEKQRLLKDRTLLIGNNLIFLKESTSSEFFELKKRISEIELEIKSIKQLNKRILSEMSSYARKSEIEILQKQFEMFEPLKFVKMNEIKEIISKEIDKRGKNVNP